MVITDNFLNVFPVRLEDDTPSLELFSEVGEHREGRGGNERFAPSLSSVLDVLLELDPPRHLPPLVVLLHEPRVHLDEDGEDRVGVTR